MQRKPFLSIEDILGIRPPPKETQYCTHSRRCCAVTRPCSTSDHHTEGYNPRSCSRTDHAEDTFSHSRACVSDRLTSHASWQMPPYYGGYSAPGYNRKQYWQQYYIAYGRYASQLYLRDHYNKQPRRRMRASFTHEQVLKLQKVFQSKKYLGNRERTELAQKLNMTEQQIKIWFQNRRYKEKKQLKSEESLQPLCSTWKEIHEDNFLTNDKDFESRILEQDECIEIL